MKNFCSFNELEDLGEALVRDYLAKAGKCRPSSVDIDGFLREYLGLTIVYESFAEDNPGRIAFLSDGKRPLRIHNGAAREQVVFPKDTVILERYLLRQDEKGRRRFTLAHEGAHKILEKHIPAMSATHFRSEWDTEIGYGISELREMMSLNEMYANRLGAVLIMPRFLVERAVKKYNRGSPVRVYGDCILDPESRSIMQLMADSLGVSFSALLHRLRELSLIDYRPAQEYIEKHLLFGGTYYD